MANTFIAGIGMFDLYRLDENTHDFNVFVHSKMHDKHFSCLIKPAVA